MLSYSTACLSFDSLAKYGLQIRTLCSEFYRFSLAFLHSLGFTDNFLINSTVCNTSFNVWLQLKSGKYICERLLVWELKIYGRILQKFKVEIDGVFWAWTLYWQISSLKMTLWQQIVRYSYYRSCYLHEIDSFAGYHCYIAESLLFHE